MARTNIFCDDDARFVLNKHYQHIELNFFYSARTVYRHRHGALHEYIIMIQNQPACSLGFSNYRKTVKGNVMPGIAVKVLLT